MVDQGEETKSPTRFANLAYQILFGGGIGAVECCNGQLCLRTDMRLASRVPAKSIIGIVEEEVMFVWLAVRSRLLSFSFLFSFLL